MQLTANRKLDKWLGYFLIAALIPVTRLLGIVLRRDHRIDKAPKQILFIKLLGLGSLIVATDAIKAMRQHFPFTKFILLTDQNIAEGIKPFGVFDELWVINTGRLAGTCRDAVKYLLRSWREDVWVVDLEVYSKLTTVYALMTMARNRFGFYLHPVLFRKYLNTHNVLFDRQGVLEDNYATMAGAVAGRPLTPVPPPVGRNDYHKPYILINNTCSDLALTRKLPDETVVAVCNWILQNTSYKLAFMGTAKDRAEIERLMARCNKKDKLLNLAGQFDFESYYRFMRHEGACLVTIDSGPLHMARKLGLPTVSVWGPTDPANFLKADNRHLYIYQKEQCSPCVHVYEKLPCGGNNRCMKRISAADVIEKLRQLLDHA